VFLRETVTALALTNTSVVRGRAEEWAGRLVADVIVARAVAPLDRLAVWCLPLVGPGGRVLAIKGANAALEIDRSAAAISRAGGGRPQIRSCGAGVVDPLATVVEIVKVRVPPKRRRRA
jgi:16S rRNA (guanine527-N7)-methyltransferase